MNDSTAVEVTDVTYRYPPTRSRRRRRESNDTSAVSTPALDGVSFDVQKGECFALLGPNGGGKTTLFRLLSTLIPLQSGRVSIFGTSLDGDVLSVRQKIGVVFQASSLDRKLTVAENLRQQATLYGLSRQVTEQRIERLTEQFGLADRQRDLAEQLSGGQRRRVELAKGLIHEPTLLLMDEPTSGLDPGVRSDLWRYLRDLQLQLGVTILLTTHLLEEAERVDRLAILNQGQLVALDSPDMLREQLGQRVITIQATAAHSVAADISARFAVQAQVIGDDWIRIEDTAAQIEVNDLLRTLGDAVQAITVGKPTLEDVFIKRTGHRFWNDQS